MAARRIFSTFLRYQSRSLATTIQAADLSSSAYRLAPFSSKNTNRLHPFAPVRHYASVEPTIKEEEEGKKSDEIQLVDDEKVEVNYSAESSSLKTSIRHDMAMVFTCRVCETRSVKTVCRESYEKGVVVVKCGGCSNLHLIADRLGWFGEPSSVEDFLAARGEEIRSGSVDTLSLTPQDLAGSASK